ncbi:response regulator transcription factor [Methylobacterium trifolii]|uniref:Transcriptional regulatory protein RcsB n=1 Tax=Methylobacterium trifolii TaxID=1003092 RepID=A0ABQ4TSN4_9HYPH|nr:response regulator transcription factor [Methylobacterium trifolii]GJE58046.1 Transcriptional regulatory protein RcsB [Methylobacterium trifolii]
MRTAVGVLIMDEPSGLNATFRATLEHLPALHTIGEADLEQAGSENSVALVVVDEARLSDAVARVVGLKERLPGLRTLVAFQALTGADLRALLTAGADAFVARTATPREVCAALLALAEGSDHLTVPDEPEIAPPETGDALGLTPREAEVLRFLSAGFSNKEVARRLTLSVRTVETHRLNLRRKTQTGRLKDLVTLARQLGLAPVVEESRRDGGPSRH